MMITLLLIGILTVSELFFLIWNLKEHTRHEKIRLYVRLGGALLLLFGLLTGILEGLSRYGLLLLILCIQAGLSFLFLSKREARPVKTGRSLGRFLGNMCLYTMALFSAIMFPQYKEPQVTGIHQVVEKEYTWVDESRTETFSDTGENRSVTVKIWYPAEEGTYPLVIFSHGAFGILDSNYSTCKELASNGYVAVSIAHPYHALFVKDTTGKMTMIDNGFLQEITSGNGTDTPEHNEEVYLRSQKWMAVRTGDMNFVLDTLLEKQKSGEEGPFCKINPDKIGLFGHSLGGATAVSLGRQRTDIDAVIDLEGTMLGEYTGCEDGIYIYNPEPYPIPVLDVNSRAVYDEASSDTLSQEYVNYYMGKNAVDFHEVIFEDAAHLNFTDLPLVSPILAGMLGTGKVNARECIENMNEMVLHYFDYYLKDSGTWTIPEVYESSKK